MGLRYSKQMLSLVSKHKMELFYSGLFVGLFCGWLNWFGSALGGHLKTGHTWSLQNRPMESGRDERFLRF
jgi:hypothetical protein